MKRLRWWTFGVLAWLDVALYVDTALRWQQGLSFVGGAQWTKWTVGCVGAWLLCVAWLTLTGAGLIRHAILAFLAFSWGFFIASSGHPHYDWRSLPLFGGLYGNGNIGSYVSDGGYGLALMGAMFHGALGFSVKRPLRVLAPWSIERWLCVVGLACCLVEQTVRFRAIDVTVSVPPPSTSFEALRLGIGTAHLKLGIALVVVSTVMSVWRLFWIRRVRRGRVAGYRIEEAPVAEPGRLARLWPLPLRWLPDVLFRVSASGSEPVGLVPSAWGASKGADRAGTP